MLLRFCNVFVYLLLLFYYYLHSCNSLILSIVVLSFFFFFFLTIHFYYRWTLDINKNTYNSLMKIDLRLTVYRQGAYINGLCRTLVLLDRFIFVDSLSYFSFHPVLHNCQRLWYVLSCL